MLVQQFWLGNSDVQQCTVSSPVNLLLKAVLCIVL